jgi:hypothetical protein
MNSPSVAIPHILPGVAVRYNPAPMQRFLAAALAFLIFTSACAASVVYEGGGDGPGKGKHVVFLAGDEEYRSEEGLPMLAKILSRRHGFKCTVLFPLDEDGTINPDNNKSLAGAEAIDSADAIVMLLRFRAWPDEQMKHFVDRRAAHVDAPVPFPQGQHLRVVQRFRQTRHRRRMGQPLG